MRDSCAMLDAPPENVHIPGIMRQMPPSPTSTSRPGFFVSGVRAMCSSLAIHGPPACMICGVPACSFRQVVRMDETEATRQAAEHSSSIGQAGYLLALAAWGAITHAIQKMRRAKSISVWSLAGETFVCVFAGFIAGLISSGLGASESLTWAAAAAAGGHFGPRTLYLLRDRLFEHIGGEQ